MGDRDGDGRGETGTRMGGGKWEMRDGRQVRGGEKGNEVAQL